MRIGFDKDTDFTEGVILLLDKPYEWTSFNVVSKVRSLLRHVKGLKNIKVGHAGTLDPLATGLLVICIGKATKQVDRLIGEDKEYIATFVVGETTSSFDLEKPIDARFPTEHITEQLIRDVAASFVGPQMQEPPLFSAKSVNGKRAYEMARKGSDMRLDPVPIVISEVEVLSINFPEVTLRIACSKGTYIRAFARDLGLRLNSGAYLKNLHRTKSGEFLVSDALSLENFEKNFREM